MRVLLNVLERLIAAVVTCGFLVGLVLNFSNVVGRYVFLSPIYWAEEATIFAVAWCVFLGAALVALRGDHLRVEVLEWVLPKKALWVLAIVSHLVTILLMTFIAWQAWALVEMVRRMQQTSIVGEIPMTVPYGAVLIGSVLIAFASAVRTVKLITGTEAPSS